MHTYDARYATPACTDLITEWNWMEPIKMNAKTNAKVKLGSAASTPLAVGLYRTDSLQVEFHFALVFQV
jgi:hypothetical protein